MALVIPIERDKLMTEVSVESAPEPSIPTIIKRNLRDQIEDVFNDLGGVEGMSLWAKESTANKRIFYKDILPKLIPKEIVGEFSGPNKGPMRMVVEWQDSGPFTDPTEAREAIMEGPAKMIMEAVTFAMTEDD